jgi:hypothetical protein
MAKTKLARPPKAAQKPETSAVGYKEKIIDSLYWIGHSIYPDEVGVSETSQSFSQGIEEFLRVCNQGTADRLILKLRKKQLLDMRENRLRKLLSGN